MPTPTITIRLPDDLRAALATRAADENLALRTFIVRALAALCGQQVVQVSATRAKAEKTFARATTQLERDEAVVERGVIADPTKPRTGYGIAVADCEHPRARRKQFSYMTKCLDCGTRLDGPMAGR